MAAAAGGERGGGEATSSGPGPDGAQASAGPGKTPEAAMFPQRAPRRAGAGDPVPRRRRAASSSRRGRGKGGRRRRLGGQTGSGPQGCRRSPRSKRSRDAERDSRAPRAWERDGGELAGLGVETRSAQSAMERSKVTRGPGAGWADAGPPCL
jgi:hypothetical protein